MRGATTSVSLLPKIIGYLLTDCGSTLEMRLVLDSRHGDDVLNGHCEATTMIRSGSYKRAYLHYSRNTENINRTK
jgi:hypothetical protein